MAQFAQVFSVVYLFGLSLSEVANFMIRPPALRLDGRKRISVIALRSHANSANAPLMAIEVADNLAVAQNFVVAGVAQIQPSFRRRLARSAKETTTERLQI